MVGKLFRTKPVVKEAIQFTGSNCFEVLAFMGRTRDVIDGELMQTDCPVINTLEGPLYTSPGDWIIRGVRGEYYPCKPDVFEKTYEPLPLLDGSENKEKK